MKNFKSPYSKMYLVSPGVYDKLLTCLDEKDKKSTELLNIEKEKEDRPGEKIIEDITAGELQEQELNDNNDEMINENIETVPETPEVFGENEPNQSDNFTPEDIQVNDDFQTPDQQINQQQLNPIKNPCITNTNDPNRIVKESSYYKPNISSTQQKINQQTAARIVKKYKALKPSFIGKIPQQKLIKPRIIMPEIRKPNIIMPEIRKPNIIMPEIMRVQQDNLLKPDITIPTVGNKKHQCPVCMKFYARPWGLARHVGHVHKNIGSVATILGSKDKQSKIHPTTRASNTIETQNIITPIVQKNKPGVRVIDDGDTPMIEPFDNWVRLGKRSSTQAKFPTITYNKKNKRKQNKTEKPGNFEEWN